MNLVVKILFSGQCFLESVACGLEMAVKFGGRRVCVWGGGGTGGDWQDVPVNLSINCRVRSKPKPRCYVLTGCKTGLGRLEGEGGGGWGGGM